MVGAGFEVLTRDRSGQRRRKTRPVAGLGQTSRPSDGRGFRWLGLIVTLSVWIPLCCALVQCGRAPNASTVAAPRLTEHGSASVGVSFEDRFPAPLFKDRFEGAQSGLLPRPSSNPSPQAAPTLTPSDSFQAASLGTHILEQRYAIGEDRTTLVSLKSSAFPYFGNIPRSDEPFLNVSTGERRGHRGLRGHVYWQDETFNDNRVLIHVPKAFDVGKPGVIVLFFHGNGATLERDVRDRQMVPQQISDSGVNAVLLAPQLAVDATDSSAGKFWQPGGLKRFLAEAANHLAEITGDPRAAKTFAAMPVVIVGYSGGFLPTAYSLDVGGLGGQVRGVLLLDSLYGELDKFASWIANNRDAFFVSSYTRYTKRHDEELIHVLRDKGIAVSEKLDQPLKPGSVMFVETPDGVTHRDYVTHAWTENPVKEVLVKMAEAPALARVASDTLHP